MALANPFAGMFANARPAAGANQQQAPNQQQPNQNQQQPNQQGNQNPSGAPSSTNNQENKEQQDPMQLFSKMFDTSPESAGKEAPSFKMKPEIVKQVSDSLDFSSHLTPEMMQKFKDGDFSAMADLVNGLGRQIYTTSLDHTSQLTDAFVNARSTHDRSGIDRQVNSRLAKNSLSSVAAKSPIAKAHLERISDEILRANPDATPEFIDEKSREYFMMMAQVINPDMFTQSNQQQSGKPQVEQDWDNWLSPTPKKQ